MMVCFWISAPYFDVLVEHTTSVFSVTELVQVDAMEEEVYQYTECFEGIPTIMVTEGGKRGLICPEPMRVEISTNGPYSWASTVGDVKILLMMTGLIFSCN